MWTRKLLAAACLTVCVVQAPRARPYGPGVHVREADHYADARAPWVVEELRPVLRLGAVFPDIRSAGVALPVNSHGKGLGEAIEAVAEADGADWKRAFALGYRLHTASDTAAQVHYIPWLTASSDLQLVNLYGLDSASAVGDNELLVEGYGDLYSGDLEAFVDMVWTFVVEDPAALEAVVDLFMEGLVLHVGDGLDAAAVRAELEAFWASVASQLETLDPEVLKDMLADLRAADLEAVLQLLSSGLLSDFYGGFDLFPEGVSMDQHEIARLMAHPVGADPESFFGSYDALFAELGADILDDTGYASWPWYQGTTIAASVLGGFALASETWSHHPEVVLFHVAFETGDGQGLTNLDAAAAPPEVVARSTVFLAHGEPRSVTMDVLATGAGFSGPVVVVGSATHEVVRGSAWTEFEVTFDPSPYLGEARVFDLRWRVDGETAPCLTSDWDAYAIGADAPLFREPYRSGTAGVVSRLPVDHAAPLATTGWLRGHAIHPDGHRGIAATVTSGQFSTTAQSGGGFAFESLEPGTRSLSARALGYGVDHVPADVKAGVTNVVDLPLVHVPILTVDSPWSPERQSLVVTWDVDHFPVYPSNFEVAIGQGDDPETIAPWVSLGPLWEVEVTFEDPLADGSQIRPWVRADGGPAVGGDPVTIDGSAPPTPALSVVSDGCQPALEVVVASTDPHSPIVLTQASLDGSIWLTGDPVTLSRPDGPPPYLVYGRAQNAAGLWSQVAEALLCAGEPTSPEPDPVPSTGSGGGCAAGETPPFWALLGFLAWVARRRLKPSAGRSR